MVGIDCVLERDEAGVMRAVAAVEEEPDRQSLDDRPQATLVVARLVGRDDGAQPPNAQAVH